MNSLRVLSREEGYILELNISYHNIQVVFKVFKCSFFGGVLTEFKTKLLFDCSLDSELLSKKNAFSCSMKNIPLPTKDSYQKNLIFKLKSFIKRIRWKAFFFDKNSESNKQSNINFDLKSVKTPPKNERLEALENDLYGMVKNIEFKNVFLFPTEYPQ